MPQRTTQTTSDSDSEEEEHNSHTKCGVFMPDPEDSGKESDEELNDESKYS